MGTDRLPRPLEPKEPQDNTVWELSGSDECGWYLEGHTNALTLEGAPIGWFCMELESFDQVLTQLKELGFYTPPAPTPIISPN